MLLLFSAEDYMLIALTERVNYLLRRAALSQPFAESAQH